MSLNANVLFQKNCACSQKACSSRVISRTIQIIILFVCVLLYSYGKHFALFDNSREAGNIREIGNSTLSKNFPSLRRKAMNATGKYSFVHISKCAGATWIKLLKDLPLKVCPREAAGPEHSVWYQNNKACPDVDYHLITLRSPRHHLFSLFTECKYDGWGERTTKNTGFPRSGNNTEEDDEFDFNLWLDHFVPMGPEKIDMYRCYHPANYQSRALTSKSKDPHGVDQSNLNRFEPNATTALRTYWEMDFVAITEFTHESRCMMYYRLGPNAPLKALLYLDNLCTCHPKKQSQSIEPVHIIHHVLGHRSTLRDLPQNVLSKIEELTAIDSQIYIIALKEFISEIAWLESNSALGRRVLCDDVLEKKEPELAYLDLNVERLYLDAVGKT